MRKSNLNIQRRQQLRSSKVMSCSIHICIVKGSVSLSLCSFITWFKSQYLYPILITCYLFSFALLQQTFSFRSLTSLPVITWRFVIGFECSALEVHFLVALPIQPVSLYHCFALGLLTFPSFRMSYIHCFLGLTDGCLPSGPGMSLLFSLILSSFSYQT